ncbi:hypothetical protein Ahy_B05g079003 [Arachis hypogaea]|uniref:Ubiquitin-like protease family profile domain-containing protein n=1 Tax=Arachis hypogaea TaxID=3818 RepID=A0A444Z8S2_ARAHY|nr:hypothetical protein Ahy_B05g079003 [Arachis hypogaea]
MSIKNSGFKDNEYKEFQVRREAVEWLNSGGDNSGEHDNDRGGGGQPSNDNRGTLSSYFRGLSITSGEKSVSIVGGCSSSFEVVVDFKGRFAVPCVKKEEEVVVAGDMEEMLRRVCVAVSFPPPSYYHMDSCTREGGNVVGFIVVISDNHLGLKLITRGVLFSDEVKARQDASLKMLKKIVETTKLTVVDFNYNRVRELELEKSRLKEEVSALQSYLFGITCKSKLMDVAITQSLNQRSNWLSYVKLDLVPEKEGIGLYCTFLAVTLAQELKLLMEVTMTKHAKATETDPSMDEQQAMESGIDKDVPNDGTKSSNDMDHKLLDIFSRINEHLRHEDRTTEAILISQADQIQKLTEVIMGHGKVLKALLREQRKSSDVVHEEVVQSVKKGSQKVLNPQMCAHPKSKVCEGTKASKCNTTRNKEKAKVIKSGQQATKKGKGKKNAEGFHSNIPAPPLKRKLYFDPVDDSNSVSDVRQQSPGTPFTYYTHLSSFMNGAEMPECFDLLFRPSPGVQFIGMELAVAAYIFSATLPKKEMLVLDDHCNETRESLQTLIPGRIVVDDDVEQGQTFYPRCSSYILVEPEIGQQAPNSVDCGIWVAQWMIQSHVWRDYNLQVVNDATRMRLAVDLVMGRHNVIRNDISQMAVDSWDKMVRSSVKKTRNATNPPLSPNLSF